MYEMFIELSVIANSPLISMGLYTAFDRTPLPRIGDLPNGLCTNLKFQNQAIQCFFVRATLGEVYTTELWEERATSI